MLRVGVRRFCNLVVPVPPSDGDCCGTGCQNCVWIQYWEDLQEYEAKKKAKEAKTSATQVFEKEMKDKDVDPAMKAFIKMEKKKREKGKMDPK